MKITLLADDKVRLEGAAAAMSIEAESPDMAYSPFHMVASGLGTCIYSLLQSWASHANLESAGLMLEISWGFADAPHRVASYEVHIHWPALPPPRRNAALRAATLCPVHATLQHPPGIHMEIAP